MPTEPPRTVGDLVALGRDFLARHGITSARLETELLVAKAIGTDRLHVFLELDRPVGTPEVDAARELLVRRSKGEPCAYLTGEREFYGRSFAVRQGVLIPRPETELLVDLARERLAALEAPRVHDLGTGSGCLAITLALECPSAKVSASDISAEALAVARENAQRLGAEVEFFECDGPAPLPGLDLLVCNPPYVDPDHSAELAEDVRTYEPGLALFAPEGDPDHWVRRLVLETDWPSPVPRLLIELGHDQAARVAALLRAEKLEGELHRDLAGTRRVLECLPAARR